MTCKNPRISIGLPVFNGENYLGAALDALLAQTYTDFELVVCDNASTDATEAICRRYAAADSRIRYYRNPSNLGAGANFNRVFELSTGTYFKWAAHDDLIGPTYLERCITALECQPDAILAQSLVGIIDAAGALHDVADNDLQLAASTRPSRRFAALARQPRHCWEQFGLIRRDLLAKTALIAPYSWSDVALCAELALLGRFVLVPEVLFFNRHHTARFSQTVLFDREASWRWWCRPDGHTRSRIDLCPTWQIQINFARMIPKHLADRRERRRAYTALFRHLFTPYTLYRLISEPITALDPRLLAAGRKIKGWLGAAQAGPALKLAAGSRPPEVSK